MALIARLPVQDAVTAAARALEQLLGHDVMLTVGEPVFAAPERATLPADESRSVSLPFGDGVIGEITLVAASQFATSMAAATPGASFEAAALTVLVAAGDTITAAAGVPTVEEHAGEIATETLLTSVDGDFAVVPIYEGDEAVACVVVRLVDAAPPVVTGPAVAVVPASPASPAATASPASPGSPGKAAAPAPAPDLAMYEFQPLGDGSGAAGAPRPLTLLHDVRMQLVAELGRRPMKVRDLMTLTPGTVIELDRAAGSPVDVLVNGTLIAHGEVVVVDDEFGIRVSEIITGDT